MSRTPIEYGVFVTPLQLDLLTFGPTREEMRRVIQERHYTRSVPSGKSWYYWFEGAIVVFSIPANPFISAWLVGEKNRVLELSRLWAPDEHEPNLLTRALASVIRRVRLEAPDYTALVSYADPSAGHHGGVYRAASWVYLGPASETRSYRAPDGTIVARRAFHSGARSMRKAEILAAGYSEHRALPKQRFARGLTRKASKAIEARRAV